MSGPTTVDDLFGGAAQAPPAPPIDPGPRIGLLLGASLLLVSGATMAGLLFSFFQLGAQSLPTELTQSTWAGIVTLAALGLHTLAVPGALLALWAWHRTGEEIERAGWQAGTPRPGPDAISPITLAGIASAAPFLNGSAAIALIGVGAPIPAVLGVLAAYTVYLWRRTGDEALDLHAAPRHLPVDRMRRLRRLALLWLSACMPSFIAFTLLYGALMSQSSGE